MSISEVSLDDGLVKFENAVLNLDFINNNFSIVGLTPISESTFSERPIYSQIISDQIRIDYHGCEVVKISEFICLFNLTSSSNTSFELVSPEVYINPLSSPVDALYPSYYEIHGVETTSNAKFKLFANIPLQIKFKFHTNLLFDSFDFYLYPRINDKRTEIKFPGLEL